MKTRSLIFPPRHRRAFTLVELLCALAIIGVLAAVLLPVVASARASARTTQCAGNLRQLGVLTGLFAADNKHQLPRQSWEFVLDLWPYASGESTTLPTISGNPPAALAGTVFECPDVYDDPTTVKRSYGINARLLGAPTPDKVVRTTDLRSPGSTLLYGDVLGDSRLYRTTLNPRHKGRLNLVYADGRVAPATLTPELAGDSDAVYWTLLWRGQ